MFYSRYFPLSRVLFEAKRLNVEAVCDSCPLQQNTACFTVTHCFSSSEVNSGFFYKSAQEREKLVAAEREFINDRVKRIIELKKKVCDGTDKNFLIINQKVTMLMSFCFSYGQLFCLVFELQTVYGSESQKYNVGLKLSLCIRNVICGIC